VVPDHAGRDRRRGGSDGAVDGRVSEAGRRYVVDQLVAAAGWVGSRLPDADGPAIDALIDDHDPAGIAHRDDAFVLSARTVHTGTRVR
jgi:hypothetical protein